MPNHYHLLVRLPFALLRPFAAGLQQTYALCHHRRHGTCGVLWQGRYKSKPVADDASLARCGRYIERNPVRAKLAELAWLWPFSSAGFYALGRGDELTDTDARYAESGLSAAERKAYAAMLRDDEDDQWMQSQTGLAIGPAEFAQRFTETGGHLRPRRGPSRRCARNTTEVLQ